jgi:hypothetical protein
MHHIYYWQIQKKSERKLKKKLKKIEKKNRKNMVMCSPWYVPTAACDLILFSIFFEYFFALFMQHNEYLGIIVQVMTGCHYLYIALLSCVKGMMITCIIYIIGKSKKIGKENKKKFEKIRSCAALGTYQQPHVTLFYFRFFSNIFSHFSCNTMNI